MKTKAIFKFNGGNPVLLCSQCGAIIKNSRRFTEEEQLACSGKLYLESQYCNGCKICKEMEKKKYKDGLLPIEWESWDELGYLIHGFNNATFLDDFGKFSKGETYPIIEINYVQGSIKAWDDNLVKKQLFKVVPINE